MKPFHRFSAHPSVPMTLRLVLAGPVAGAAIGVAAASTPSVAFMSAVAAVAKGVHGDERNCY